MNAIAEMSRLRFTLLLVGLFAVLTAWSWYIAGPSAPRNEENEVRGDQTEPVIVPDPTYPRPLR